jgi:BRCT domain type II-containing protein
MPTKPTIQNQTFLFTGTLTEFTRDEAEALVEANGGKVLSGVSAKLNYLVVGTDAGSKLDKAKALGTIKILTEKEFLKMVPKAGKATTVPTKSAKPKEAAAPATSAILIGDFEVYEKDLSLAISYGNALKEVKKLGKGWSIPDMDQLKLMYANRKKLGSYAKDCYWSCAPSGSGFGGGTKYWVVNFKNGDFREFFEDVENVLRPIKMLKK